MLLGWLVVFTRLPLVYVMFRSLFRCTFYSVLWLSKSVTDSLLSLWMSSRSRCSLNCTTVMPTANIQSCRSFRGKNFGRSVRVRWQLSMFAIFQTSREASGWASRRSKILHCGRVPTRRVSSVNVARRRAVITALAGRLVKVMTDPLMTDDNTRYCCYNLTQWETWVRRWTLCWWTFR